LTNAQETVEIPTSSAKDLTYTATWWRRSTTTTAFTPNSDGKPEVAYHSMVLGGQISVMFYVYFPDDGKTTGDNLVTHENSTISFIMSGATEPESYNIWTNECKKTLTDGTHTFYGYECFISSIQMADDITVKLTCTNNDAYKDGVELQKYKASTYLSALKGEEAAQSVEAQALGVAIMDYGHYVQVMLNGKNGWKLGEDHEAIDAGSSELTESDANLLDTHSIISTKEAYDTNIAEMKFSLLLDYVTTLRLYLKKAEDYEGDITATLANGDTHTITAKAEETERTDDDVKGYYVLDIANIAAHELADKHIITITAGSQDFTVTLSALSYAKVILANESDTYDDAMKNAMTALCNYYTATTTYQASIASYPDYVGATDSNN
ncbi:MAG: hypothetical protein IJP89_03825, partial [Synergistaceae bacterium]|nr:hypothetical protein [Synergistaceae bacterium]